MIVVNVEYSSPIHESLCTIGDLIVIVGAGWKCKTTVEEISTIGFHKYSQAMVRNFLVSSNSSFII